MLMGCSSVKMQSDFNNDAAYFDVRWDEVMCLHVKLMVNPQTHA